MKTFGWKSSDPFVRSDIEEFNRELQDKLESGMKVCGLHFAPFLRRTGGIKRSYGSQGTRVEDTIRKLFVGKMEISIKCVNVDYRSSRIEEFRGEKVAQP